ncbi:hypothetical protein MIND_00032100 [Mycena indigotica]|uniref:Glycosyltransferase family 49 protein n=1 Tax=Mycena indigotica TaxID=2126181 RepID=A0A8H6TEE8_9AGAR|nr:uncharacterized protein MIND_00032100 [Mycena indigotica]KAF7315177.1 hypothetical protein MIND_00032100 [Mycena indigotica]
MFIRLLRSILALYTLAAVIHTTHFFIIAPLHSAVSSIVTHLSPHFLSLRLSRPILSRRENEPVSPPIDTQALFKSDDLIHWKSSDFSLQHGFGHDSPVAMSESLFLSKAFANSMQPSKILPFFYRASGSFKDKDITITTLVTSNRFQVFGQLVEHYSGPISATIHIRNSTEHVKDLLNSLRTLYLSSPKMATNVDVHLVIDAFDRQFNTWRNIARFFARTDFVMMLDIDFFPCTDFRSSILNNPAAMSKLQSGTAALVLPAFEYPVHEDGIDATKFPRSKASLVPLVHTGRIGMFHASWALGHGSTDYDRFLAAGPGEIYKVTKYQAAYEPYIVFKRDGPPWCDERFVGYGGNKAACLFEMYLSGISYYVLTDHFLIHQNHLYEETARRAERKYNRKIYTEFKEEACLRYLKRFRYDNTTRGQNARVECRKFRSQLP